MTSLNDSKPLGNGCSISSQQSWAREIGLAKIFIARPGLAVSMPIAWDELKKVIGGDQWSMSLALARQRSLNRNTWDGYWRSRQGITIAMRRAIGMQRCSVIPLVFSLQQPMACC